MRQEVSIFTFIATISPQQDWMSTLKLQFNEELRPDLINGLKFVGLLIESNLAIFFIVKASMCWIQNYMIVFKQTEH